MTLRVLIVDDEAPARSELRHVLQAHDVEVVAEAAGASEAVRAIEAVAIDVIFLDVEMPGVSGIELARAIAQSSRPPAVVFVTAHAGYAVDAFAVEAVDYLLKPVDPERLTRVLERLATRDTRSVASPIRIPVVASGGTELLELDRVHYVQADGDYSRVHTFDRSYLSTSSLRELEAALPADRFVRVHRSYLVNLARVAAIRRIGPDNFSARARRRSEDGARCRAPAGRAGARAPAALELGEQLGQRLRRAHDDVRARSATSGGDSGETTPTRTATSSPSSAAKPSRSVVSSPAYRARRRPCCASRWRTAVPLFASSGGSTSSTNRPHRVFSPAASAAAAIVFELRAGEVRVGRRAVVEGGRDRLLLDRPARRLREGVDPRGPGRRLRVELEAVLADVGEASRHRRSPGRSRPAGR